MINKPLLKDNMNNKPLLKTLLSHLKANFWEARWVKSLRKWSKNIITQSHSKPVIAIFKLIQDTQQELPGGSKYARGLVLLN